MHCQDEKTGRDERDGSENSEVKMREASGDEVAVETSDSLKAVMLQSLALAAAATTEGNHDLVEPCSQPWVIMR